jgi:hypothetical protein
MEPEIPTFEEVMAEPEEEPRHSATLQEAWDRVKDALPTLMGFSLGLNDLMNDGKEGATPWVACANSSLKVHYLAHMGGSPTFGATEIEALDKLAERLEAVEHR